MAKGMFGNRNRYFQLTYTAKYINNWPKQIVFGVKISTCLRLLHSTVYIYIYIKIIKLKSWLLDFGFEFHWTLQQT